MRPPTAKRLRRSLIPTAASLVVHAAVAGAIVTVTVEHLQPPPDRPRLLDITAIATPDGDDQPEQPADPAPEQRDQPAPPRSARADDSLAQRTETARASAQASIARAATVAPPPSTRPAAPPAVVRAPRRAPAASFAGVQARAATRIVYAVDASGAMVHTMSFVLDELSRSIGRLQPTQSFQILLVSDTPGAPTTRSPPIDPDDDGLIRATSRHKAAARDWLATVVAGGRSSPLAGLDAALRLDPDLVFLLARGIQRTGTDDAALNANAGATLARLDALNPLDPATGDRPAVIKTLQFIEPDPTGLLTRIARVHGDGEGSTRLITPEDMGAEPAETIASDTPPGASPSADTRALDAAAAGLAESERSLTALAVIAGVATAEEAARVRTAADRALAILADIPPATPRTADARPNLLRARASVLRAAAEPADTEASRAWRDDHARRALADAGPLRIVDPRTDADRDLVVADAARLLGRPGEAHERILTILENAVDADLDAPTLAAAEITALTAATADDPRGDAARRARDAIAGTLDADRRDALGTASPWADPAWRAVAAAALARSRRDAGEPPARVLAPLLAELSNRSVPEPQRRALVAPRLHAVAADLPAMPPVALRALADHARWTDRPLDAAELLLRAHEIDARPDDLRDAAAILHARNDPRAADLFYRFAIADPAHPDAADALTIALGEPDAIEQAPPQRLRAAIAAAPDHPLAPVWRTELARTTRGTEGLDLLDPPGTDRAEPMTSDAAAVALELLDELLADSPGDPALLARAAGIAERAGGSVTPDRRLDLAQSLLKADPARALDTLDGFAPPDDARRTGAELLRLRAHAALGDDPRAFRLARALAERLTPDQPGFWEANTLWLELGAKRGGADATAAARAHVARLRRLDPTLGGEPWNARLNALARE
jgi:hypothetical protein